VCNGDVSSHVQPAVVQMPDCSIIIIKLTVMRRTRILFFLAVVSLFTATTAFINTKKEASGWFLLGDKKVGFSADHDVIRFGNWKDDVRQLKIRVTDGPLHMYDMKVYFDNGGVQ